jgi:hypothetical protein
MSSLNKSGIFLNKTSSLSFTSPICGTPSFSKSKIQKPSHHAFKRRETLSKNPFCNISNGQSAVMSGSIFSTPSKLRQVNTGTSSVSLAGISALFAPTGAELKEMEKELELLKSEKTELLNRVQQKESLILDCEASWRRKYENMMEEMSAQIEQTKMNWNENSQILERKVQHLEQINKAYVSRLESLGVNPFSMTNLILTENETKKREEVKLNFNRQIEQIRSLLSLCKEDIQLQLDNENIISNVQSIDVEAIEKDLAADIEHLETMKKQFEELKKIRDTSCMLESTLLTQNC